MGTVIYTPFLEETLKILEGSNRFLPAVVLENDHGIQATRLHLAAEGFKIEIPFTHRHVLVLLPIVVMEMEFDKAASEHIQPIVKFYL
jgi:hypothetical protein